jgi:general secretion pathway protein J
MNRTRPVVTRGFTLVEVLVALFILAIVAGLSWRGIDGMLRTRDASQQRLELQMRLQSVIGQWEADLAAVQDTDVVPALQFDGASLRLTRSTEGGVQLVVWSLRGNRWMRWSAPPVTHQGELLDLWMRSQQLQGNEQAQINALNGIASWQLYFWRDNAWSNAQSSAGAAPSNAQQQPPPQPQTPAAAARTPLPGGVRLALEFTPDSGFVGGLTRDVIVRGPPT